MIVDSHCHVWPDHIAAQVLSVKIAGLDAMGDGTLAGLTVKLDEAGIDYGCCLGVATVPKNLEKTNEFIGALDRSRFVPFGTIHPDRTIEENMRSIRDNGIVGVKLHPNFQGIDLADPRVIEICRALADDGIVVITHAGEGSDAAATERGSPQKVVALADAIPNLTLMACHYGAYHQLDLAEDVVVGSRVILETSWPPTMAILEPERIRAIIERHGADRVVYGSDWPMADPVAEIAGIKALGLNPEDEAKVLGGNMARMLGLAS
ncbi:MAG: amidohydrolase [Bacteroidetes bacterium]|nr:amidohydrolase [Bacteroidota bacterium]